MDLEPLLLQLASGDRDRRAHAVDALVRIGPEAVPALLKLGDATVPDLLMLQQNGRGTERNRAAAILGALGHGSAPWTPQLAATLRDGSHLIREIAARGLIRLAEQGPDPQLCVALEPLRRACSPKFPSNEEIQLYRDALAAIQAATGGIAQMPLPAAAPPPDVGALPRPAVSPSQPGTALPTPAAEPDIGLRCGDSHVVQ